MKVDTTVYESIICIFVECDAPYFLLITIFDPIELDFELNLSAYNLINLSYILTSDSWNKILGLVFWKIHLSAHVDRISVYF